MNDDKQFKDFISDEVAQLSSERGFLEECLQNTETFEAFRKMYLDGIRKVDWRDQFSASLKLAGLMDD